MNGVEADQGSLDFLLPVPIALAVCARYYKKPPPPPRTIVPAVRSQHL